MKEVDKNKSIVVQHQGLINFTRMQIGLTNKLLVNCADNCLAKGKDLLDQKKYSDAVDAFSQAIQINPIQKLCRLL